MSNPSQRTSVCPHCPALASKLFTPHGLLVHIGRMHKGVQRNGVNSRSVTEQSSSGASAVLSGIQAQVTYPHNFENLAALRSQIRILKHIPKSARCVVAGRLCELIDNCLRNNALEDWYALLTFAFTGFMIPDTGGTTSNTC
ncbi:hypothetical protein O0L34_g12980 [Tuta absoluta]|nr:hypothetical protein O0L34_g12980 [Tuta absoluta]